LPPPCRAPCGVVFTAARVERGLNVLPMWNGELAAGRKNTRRITARACA
jgi:hypothetical protein